MVAVTHEPEDLRFSGEPAELCCKCFKPTRYWFTPKDVALCQTCATTVEEGDLPTKKEWCEEVRSRFPRSFISPWG